MKKKLRLLFVLPLLVLVPAAVRAADAPRFLGQCRTNPAYEVLQLGYSRSLGKSRVTLEARAVAYQENAFDDAIELSAGWVRRSRWGTVRLGAGSVSAY